MVASTQDLDRIVALLKEKRAEEITPLDVVALAEVAAESLQSFFGAMDATIYRELREIADYIAAMRKEISALQVNELKETRIPAAGEQLNAIVKATEEATNTIMECAESVMAADARDAETFKSLVDDKMLVIFEACSFQDITGQRIAKVVETLEHIERRVARFAAAVNTTDVAGYADEFEQARAERSQGLLLNGPQLKDEGIDQNQVDSLFG